jgi:hypothetical protein
MTHKLKPLPTVLLLSLASFLPACGPSPEEAAIEPVLPDAAAVEASRELVGSLKTALETELRAALQTGGLEAGIKVCRDKAQPITAEVTAQAVDAEITRVALRLRNPANAPDELSREVLERWTAQVAAGGEIPQADVRHTTAGTIVHQPIPLGANCLMCHGDPESLRPEVTEALAAAYPADEATGFAEGDLRGAFRVVFTR